MRIRDQQESRRVDTEVDEAKIDLAFDLSTQQYTGRAGNTYEELDSYSGWNYVGITPICRMAARATVDIFDERKHGEPREQARTKRRSIRDQYSQRVGSRWKSFLDNKALEERAADSFRWWKLLNGRPNPWQTASQMRWERVLQMHLHGISLIWNVKDSDGNKTVWRMVVPVGIARPIPPGHRDMLNGGIYIQNLQWISRRFPAADLSHIRRAGAYDREIPMEDLTLMAYPHPLLRGDGFSPTRGGKDWIELAKSAERAQQRQYDDQTGGQKILVQAPLPDGKQQHTVTDLKAYQRSLDEQYRRSESMFLAVANGDVTQVGFAPHEMEYAEASQTQGPNVLSLHGTPKVAIGQGEGMTYGSVAAIMQQFGSMAVQSDLDLMADEDTATMQQEEGDAFTCEYTAPEYNDPELKEEQLKTDLDAGALSVEEYRRERGREPYGDERDKMTAGSEAVKNYVPGQGILPSGPMGGIDPTGVTLGSDQDQAMAAAAATGQNGRKPRFPRLEDAEARKPKPDRQLEQFMASRKSLALVEVNPLESPPVIAFDLDNTLAEYDVYDEFSIGEPIQGAVELVRLLKAAGMGIVIYTCRDNDALVAAWLDEHDVPADGINFNPWAPHAGGKLQYTALIDDRAINAKSPEGVLLQSVLQHLDEPHANAVKRQVKRRDFDRKYGFLFLPIAGQLGEAIKRLQAQVDDSHWSDKGVETELHITVLYGIVDDYSDEISKIMRLMGQPSFALADRITMFPVDESEVAMVVELVGDDLHALHANAAGQFAHVQTYPEYRPHITLGYLDKDQAGHYLNMTIPNATATAERLVYRHPSNPDLVIPLRKI